MKSLSAISWLVHPWAARLTTTDSVSVSASQPVFGRSILEGRPSHAQSAQSAPHARDVPGRPDAGRLGVRGGGSAGYAIDRTLSRGETVTVRSINWV